MQDRPRRQWRIYVWNVACLACGLVLMSCGGKGNGGGSTAPTPVDVGYTWALPTIDTATDGVDGEIYQALQKSCDDGDTMLAQKWQQSSSPRDVLLFAAGAQACRGAMAPARTLYQRAKDEYGLSGLGPAQNGARCDVYKSVASMVENAPRDRFPCPDGVSPAFRRSPTGVLDDPRTPEDESVAAASTAATPTLTQAPAPPSTHASKAPATRSTRSTRPTASHNVNSGGGPPVPTSARSRNTGGDKNSSKDDSKDDGKDTSKDGDNGDDGGNGMKPPKTKPVNMGQTEDPPVKMT